MNRTPTDKTHSGKSSRSDGGGREDRLKSALKANLARRKAQARARNAKTVNTVETTPRGGNED